MTRPTTRRQNEIKKKIESYLGTTDRSFSELAKKGEPDGIGESVLNDYLKKMVEDKTVKRTLHEDRTTGYRLNRPPRMNVKLNPKELLDMQLKRLDTQLLRYEQHPDSKSELFRYYYDKFVWVLFDLIAVHVWASKFKDQEIAKAWIPTMTGITLNEAYNLGKEAPVLMKHGEAVQRSALDYLTGLLERFPNLKSEFADPRFIMDYLAFDPTPGLRQESSQQKPVESTENDERIPLIPTMKPRQLVEYISDHRKDPPLVMGAAIVELHDGRNLGFMEIASRVTLPVEQIKAAYRKTKGIPDSRYKGSRITARKHKT